MRAPRCDRPFGLRALGLALCISLAASAWADTVFLKNGGQIEGRVREKDGKVFIDQPNGMIVLSADKVDHIERTASPLQEYQARLARIDVQSKTAPQDWANLGLWCAVNKMPRQAEDCYRQAIALDPNQEDARLALGYVKSQDRWLDPDEAQAARGMVRYQGAWMTPEAKADLMRLQAETARDRERARAERVALERAKAEAQARNVETAPPPVSNYGWDPGWDYGYTNLYYVHDHGRHGDRGNTWDHSSGPRGQSGAPSHSATTQTPPPRLMPNGVPYPTLPSSPTWTPVIYVQPGR